MKVTAKIIVEFKKNVISDEIKIEVPDDLINTYCIEDFVKDFVMDRIITAKNKDKK